jgi:hypothetical protein
MVPRKAFSFSLHLINWYNLIIDIYLNPNRDSVAYNKWNSGLSFVDHNSHTCVSGLVGLLIIKRPGKTNKRRVPRMFSQALGHSDLKVK